MMDQAGLAMIEKNVVANIALARRLKDSLRRHVVGRNERMHGNTVEMVREYFVTYPYEGMTNEEQLKFLQRQQNREWLRTCMAWSGRKAFAERMMDEAKDDGTIKGYILYLAYCRRGLWKPSLRGWMARYDGINWPLQQEECDFKNCLGRSGPEEFAVEMVLLDRDMYCERTDYLARWGFDAFAMLIDLAPDKLTEFERPDDVAMLLVENFGEYRDEANLFPDDLEAVTRRLAVFGSAARAWPGVFGRIKGEYLDLLDA